MILTESDGIDDDCSMGRGSVGSLCSHPADDDRLLHRLHHHHIPDQL
jgi:hypothetical protein